MVAEAERVYTGGQRGGTPAARRTRDRRVSTQRVI